MDNQLLDRADLDVEGDRIRFGLYQQDGTMQPMSCADSPHNRRFVSWVKAHDRRISVEKNDG